jgi:spore coat protein A, manganese oxidase
MSNKKSSKSFESIKSGENRNVGCQPASENSIKLETSFWRSLGKSERIFVVGLVALLSLSVFGFVGSKISSSFSSQNIATTENSGTSSPNTLTPNALNTVTTTATPVLSKEYVYAGSRLVAVEDANANAAPPADLAVWRPSSGMWYVLGGVAGSAQTGYGWGQQGDLPAPGDYDGDGKTDFSIVRPSTTNGAGVWWIVKSSTNTYYSIAFGSICPPPTTCDKIAQADYDGDGKTDPAVFRSSDGTWYIQPSGGSGGYYGVTFGVATDIPAPADYDGDGKADIGVWRNSNTTFYSANSSNGAVETKVVAPPSTPAPNPNSTPISGDYDGDGRADYAIRNGANWIIRNSSNGQIQPAIAWQNASDLAVQNDYDGDGKVDIAVWNTTNGNWFIRQSTKIGQATELRQVAWGTTGDIPVPAYYRR